MWSVLYLKYLATMIYSKKSKIDSYPFDNLDSVDYIYIVLL